jgi:hypothetical protein
MYKLVARNFQDTCGLGRDSGDDSSRFLAAHEFGAAVAGQVEY